MFNNYDQLLYIYIILLDYHVVFPISDGVWAKLGMVIWQRSSDQAIQAWVIRVGVVWW